MKKQNIYMLLACLCAVFSCVQVDEGVIDQGNEQEKVLTTFTATIEKDDVDTKTVLDGKLGDGTRKVKWQPMDTIGVLPARLYDGRKVEPFITTVSSDTTVADFEGSIAFASEYRAFYPYQETLRDSSDIFIFNLPQVQKYVEESFDPNSAPMVAVAKNGEALKFKNLCGILALRLTGNESVKSVTFIGKDADGNHMPVSGVFEATPSADSDPSLVCRKGISSVTVDCDTPVVLSADGSVPFYMMLPPATYSSFIVMVTTSDGKVMMKEATKPLTIKRSDVQPTAALAYAETIAIDLSEYGTANSYIVTEPGLYSFNAKVIGNGEFGLIEGAGFHTTRTSIEPVDAELVWEDKPGVITAPAYGGGKISFMATGKEGNALVAAKDADGNIIWSWHVWVTDLPAEQTYVNSVGKFTMLDRNIGAIRADRGEGEQWRESMGTMYFWGRKDPFYSSSNYIHGRETLTLEESIANPTMSHTTSRFNVYISWLETPNQYLWSESQKTIYDPCPLGYRVPTDHVWSGFTSTGESTYKIEDFNIYGDFDFGFNFYINQDKSETAWYPVTHHYSWSGYYQWPGNEGFYWAANYTTDSNKRRMRLYYGNEYNTEINVINSMEYVGSAHAIRCMKDENVTSVIVKMLSVPEVTSASAIVEASVAVQGDITIERAGVVYGTSSLPSLDTGTVVYTDMTSGKFTSTIGGLASLTKYYVRAFAVTDDGNTYYSDKVMSLITPDENGVVNLNIGGYANCYIVPPMHATYTFDGTVKGNSSESVGTPAIAEVLWETQLSTNYIEVNSIIDSVSFVAGKVRLNLPTKPKEGNALIAVKDASGTILWSWHIWVVDFDPSANGQVYISGNMLMDRNLGALSVVPASSDYGAYGLFYQWGRKDPFTIPDHGTIAPEGAISAVYEDKSSIDPTISNPTVVYDQSFWGYDDTLWGSVKTIYDPCPAGWRVPDRDVWDGIESSDLTTVNSTYRIIPEPYSTPQAYYPMSGVGDGWDPQWTDWFNDYSSWWTTEREVNMWVHWSNEFKLITRETDRRMSVRCMKDARFEVVTGSISDVTGSSFVAAGEYTSLDGTEITEVGFAYSEHNQEPTIAASNCGYVKVSADNPFTAVVSGLKPNTQYYVRAYAKGGYNVKYGEYTTVRTGAAGSGEGFGNGGDYEWGE